MPALQDLADLREHALHRHRPWKTLINLSDMVAADQWEVIWPDGEAEDSDPLVENLYSQALEDKMAAAGAIVPNLYVAPARGTRADEAERNSQLRRRVMKSYWERSRLRRDIKLYFRDWLHTGASYTLPWTNWQMDGRPTPPGERFPFFMKIDPRTFFPLSHNSQGDLTAGMIMRQKRIESIRSDWGDHPAIDTVLKRRQARGMRDEGLFLEEVWYFDEKVWSVSLAESMLPSEMQGVQYVSRDALLQGAGQFMEWLVPPEEHKLYGCPVTEAKRATHDDEYRGALVDLIPQLKVANNFMARLLDDLNMNIYAPVLLDNVENPEEYGSGAVLIGTGAGRAAIERDRPPVNFEARQTVQDIMAMARRQAFEPEQRAGEAGASIVSGKGTMALMGSFNNELAWAQTDIEQLLERTTSIVANFDEVWCPGRKEIWGWETTSSTFTDRYDPRTTFKGDYRVSVTYGERTGLDEQSHMTRLGLVRQLGGMSMRTFMSKAGISEDPLQEEREIAIEKLTGMFLDVWLPQQLESGNLNVIRDFVDMIDDDSKTVRQAVLDSIKQMQQPTTDSPPAAGGGQGGPADVMRMMASLGAGGVPGRAEGLPPPGGALRQLLPGQARRQIAETEPGGTAAAAI